ncbi:outer membrane protein TOM13-domain-containing protein [Morchella snyderi]|nr:outer membrane protein TOM13-domain-containing protein [Morchella snyderi]
MTSLSPSSSFVVHPSPTASSSSSGEESESPVVVYRPPTVISLVRTAAINLVLPFINGLMLGFGELFAHELAFRWGWGGTRVFPLHRATRAVGPGIEVRERKRTRDEMVDLTSLE